jgi:hypothetical protein
MRIGMGIKIRKLSKIKKIGEENNELSDLTYSVIEAP